MPVVQLDVERCIPYEGGRPFGRTGPYELVRASPARVDPARPRTRASPTAVRPRAPRAGRLRGDWCARRPASAARGSGRCCSRSPTAGAGRPCVQRLSVPCRPRRPSARAGRRVPAPPRLGRRVLRLAWDVRAAARAGRPAAPEARLRVGAGPRGASSVQPHARQTHHDARPLAARPGAGPDRGHAPAVCLALWYDPPPCWRARAPVLQPSRCRATLRFAATAPPSGWTADSARTGLRAALTGPAECPVVRRTARRPRTRAHLRDDAAAAAGSTTLQLRISRAGASWGEVPALRAQRDGAAGVFDGVFVHVAGAGGRVQPALGQPSDPARANLATCRRSRRPLRDRQRARGGMRASSWSTRPSSTGAARASLTTWTSRRARRRAARRRPHLSVRRAASTAGGPALTRSPLTSRGCGPPTS